MRNLVVHAPRIHNGGGLVLLKSILSVLGAGSIVVLDQRFPEVALPGGVRVQRMERGLGSYVLGDWFLRRLQKEDPNRLILCMSSLPPMWRLRNPVVVFVQSRYVVADLGDIAFPVIVRARLAFERIWFKTFFANADIFLVQTQSMATTLKAKFPNAKVKIAPLFEEPTGIRAVGSGKDIDFIYPASGDPHKNHARLLQAWEHLARAEKRPSLALVFPGNQVSPAVRETVEKLNRELKTKIEIWPSVAPEMRFESLDRARALIFPSLFESYGLPLVEAQSIGLPIVASELDFVRDSVIPKETFDPSSALSIARAVARFLGSESAPPAALTPGEFISVAATAKA